MPKLIVFSGLPGAGKTTRARALCAETGAVLVARDGLRVCLENLGCEWALTLSLVALARVLLHAGHHVMVDAPNLDPLDRALWHGLAAETGAALVWQHIGTRLEDCIARDAKRVISIGEHAIRDQAERYAEALEELAA